MMHMLRLKGICDGPAAPGGLTVMRRSIATVSLSGTLPEKIDAIAAAGFDGIELFEPDFTHFAGSAHELRTMCADRGLAIELFQPFRDFEGMPDAQHRRNLDRAERKFDLMSALGVQRMLVCSNTSPLALADVDLAAEQLRELAQRASQRGIRIAYEALAWGRHVKLWQQAWRTVEKGADPNLGLVLDSFHTLSLQDDPSGIARLPGDKIFFVQMADAPRLDLNVIEWARHHRNFPGQGQFDVVGFFEQAVRAGYTGPLSLEIFNDVFRESPNRRIAVDAMRSLQWLEAQIHDRLVAAGDATARQRLQEGRLVALPPMPQCHGLAFIEFAVDDASAQALDVLLGQMGFQRAGRHRSKPVLLYRQGHIHFVVNRLAHALAREHFAAHGPSVCAIGVRVDDAQAACERAVQMQSARFDPAEGPGEHRLPSIVAPGGGIVHFIDAALGDAGLFEIDFELDLPPADAAGASPAGLETVDHLVFALAPDRVDTWVLFGRAVLGLQAGDSIDVADPYGLIRNFGMADPRRQLRLVLNVSPSQRTRTARAANAKGGVVVQHIAMASSDIFATVQTLRERGARFVPISGNYHDDLGSRFDIAPDLVERMRAAGILFDRNADGDFLHACTEPFQQRFLFEIVQRIGGYDAYGTLNAPARMAAMAQQGGHTP